MHNVIVYQNLEYDIAYLSNPSDYSYYLPIVQKMLDSLKIIISDISASSKNRIAGGGAKLKHIPSDASNFTNHNDRTIKVVFVNVYSSNKTKLIASPTLAGLLDSSTGSSCI
jgi:hypothetical protein